MKQHATPPSGYTLAQILLHWVIAFLIIGQLIFAEGIEEVARASESARTVADESLLLEADIHVWVGVLILMLAAVRLILRLSHGAPAAPSDLPSWQAKLAATIHLLFYLLLFAAPISGLVAWYILPDVGAVHALVKPLLIILLLLHVLGAFFHHFAGHSVILKRIVIPTRKSF